MKSLYLGVFKTCLVQVETFRDLERLPSVSKTSKQNEKGWVCMVVYHLKAFEDPGLERTCSTPELFYFAHDRWLRVSLGPESKGLGQEWWK